MINQIWEENNRNLNSDRASKHGFIEDKISMKYTNFKESSTNKMLKLLLRTRSGGQNKLPLSTKLHEMEKKVGIKTSCDEFI